ncbi:MAG: undecaprenyldiphospho-muramoylpentapeptide beta-N-acetylglucosaminyltransferase [Candidatus Anammoxibacter sp.]
MKVIFAGGSTGGHLMAGISLAQEIKTAYPESEILFFATSKHFEKKCIQEKGFIFKNLKYVTGIKGSVYQKLKFLVGTAVDTVLSAIVIFKFKPDIIVGLGGYSSAPPIIAATMFFSPFVLIDQNLIPGKMNRLFSRWAKEIYCHFTQSTEWLGKAKEVVITGNPIRREILDAKRDVSAKYLGLSEKKRTILIIGGSQGARVINEVMIGCLAEFEECAEKLQIIHCAGEHDLDNVKKAYKQCKIDAYVCSFLSNVEFAYSLADVIISRAGAGTVTEITAVGLPAILIPYPFAADNHQYYNALELSKHGAAYLVDQEDFTVNMAVELIRGILMNETTRNDMMIKSKKLGKPGAAKLILIRIEKLIEKKKNNNRAHIKSENEEDRLVLDRA